MVRGALLTSVARYPLETKRTRWKNQLENAPGKRYSLKTATLLNIHLLRKRNETPEMAYTCKGLENTQPRASRGLEYTHTRRAAAKSSPKQQRKAAQQGQPRAAQSHTEQPRQTQSSADAPSLDCIDIF